MTRYKGLKADLNAYWRFAGIRGRSEQFSGALPLFVDLFLYLQLGLIGYRNLILPDNWLGWLVVGLLSGYTLMLLLAPGSRNRNRLIGLASIVLIMAVAIPLQRGYTPMSMANVAMLSYLVLFVLYGTRVSLLMLALYMLALTWLLNTNGGGDGSIGYTVSVVTGMFATCQTASLILFHYVFAALRDEADLRETRDSMSRLASLAHIGYYWWDHRNDIWDADDVFRELMQLPRSEYPELTVDQVFMRVQEDIREELKSRLRGPEDNEFMSLDLVFPDGSRRRFKAGSKVHRHTDGHTVRHGFLMLAD